jgi:hypothetical protein
LKNHLTFDAHRPSAIAPASPICLLSSRICHPRSSLMLRLMNTAASSRCPRRQTTSPTVSCHSTDHSPIQTSGL